MFNVCCCTQLLLCYRYNHPHILAGQGTIALEIIEQMESMGKDVDAIVVPIGGAGLIAGVSVVFKHLVPEAEVIVSSLLLVKYSTLISKPSPQNYARLFYDNKVV